MGEGVGGGGVGRGHFIHLAIYFTTTWCFAPKGLRTTTHVTEEKISLQLLSQKTSGHDAFAIPGPLLACLLWNRKVCRVAESASQFWTAWRKSCLFSRLQ